MNRKLKETLKMLLYVIVGNTLLAFSICAFVVPNDITLKDLEIKSKIQEICKELDSRYVTVITIDKDYISGS